ncbi:RNA-directed DNA polymerase, eukaryota, reverse transcriptase zinc-binding domain protein [Tanacetum coccineum]
MGSRRSKEDDVNRISISIYVTNFPENFSAKELFQSCKQYGHVVDSFIPRKRTKEGKRFGFVRFINVFNVDRLVNNLCTIWVGQFKLHANKARFQRATLNKGQGADHKKVANSPRPNSGDSGSSNSYVNAVKNHKSVDHDSPAIVLDEDCALSKDLSSSLMGRIKEFASLTNLKNALMNEGFVDLNVSYLGELWVLLEFSSVKSKEAFRDNVGVSSWFSEIRQASFDINPDGRIVWVEIEGVPLKLWTLNTFKRIVTRWGNLIDTNDSDGNCFHSKRLCLFTKSISNIYENFKIIFRGKVYWIRAKEVPGWTPDLVEDSDEEELSDDDSLEEGMKNLESENDCSNSFEVPDTVFENEGGSKKDSSVDPFGLYPLLNKKTKDKKHKESGLAQKAKKDWAKELCVKNKVNFLAIQETKMEEIDLFSVRRCWGNSTFEHLHSNSILIRSRRFSSEAAHDYGRFPFDSFTIGFISRALMISSLQLGILPLLLTLMECVTWRDRFAKPSERRANIDMRFPKTISEDQSQDLEREVSKQEIKTAVWGCGTDKSPGPDGFSFGFYRHFWPVIEHDVYMAVNHFFIHGEIPPGCNHIYSFDPKVPDANLVRILEPISLMDDILQDLPRFCLTGRCKWRNWIQSCLTSSKGSILVNGCPTNEFQFYKGLKQGDPLSPFLFILVMESLHLSFQRIVNAGMFKGIVLDQSLCLSHMFYADDAIFLGEWSDGNISTLIHVLKCFFHASGLKINLNKSKIMGINVESAQVIQAAAKLGCLVLKCPFYYLGTRVGGSMTRVQAWQEIVEKVKSRLSKWKSKTLSIGGRLTLLKSVLGSIPVFHMSIFKVPSKVLHILESIRSHFFNGHDPGSKKASWVKWNNVLTDKKRGGLGVSSLFALNRGLMIKWVWKFLSQKDSLWTKVIVAIHGVGGKIHSEWTSTGKSCWLSILSEVRSLQRKGMYVFDYLTHKMGNGESTKFWLDHWHTRGIFKDIFPRLYALESSKDVTVSSKIGDTSLVCSFRRIPRGGIEQNQFDSLVELVRSVTIVPSADRWNWNLESTGIFSVASARRRIDEICLPNIGEETRWVKCVPIKINVLAWKIKTDALPTRFNISRRGIDIQDMSCPICDNAIESTDHLFFRCGLVRDIANKVLSWWNLDHANLNSYAEWKSWLVLIRMDFKLKKMFEGKCAAVKHRLSIAVPGRAIPEWFSNQSFGNTIDLSLSQNQITNMIGLAISCIFGPPRNEKISKLLIEIKPSKEKLIKLPARPARGLHHLGIGYMSIDFLGKVLCHGSEDDDLILKFDTASSIVKCGACVVYKDDIKSMSDGIGSWIPHYDEMELFKIDSASGNNLPHGRLLLPKLRLPR